MSARFSFEKATFATDASELVQEYPFEFHFRSPRALIVSPTSIEEESNLMPVLA